MGERGVEEDATDDEMRAKARAAYDAIVEAITH